MENLFDEYHFQRCLNGYTIYDCAINRLHRYTFVLCEEAGSDDTPPITRFLIVAPDAPMENRFGWYDHNGFGFTTIARGTNPPEFVAVDTRSLVYSSNAQGRREEKPIDKVIDMRTGSDGLGIIQKIVRAADQVYALGDYRRIYRRIGIEQWIELNSEGKGVPWPADVEKGKTYSTQDVGFTDLSAFDSNDMYAVGGSGDVWHFNGTQWEQCSFPSNALLETVCCAGDGNVYITDSHGSLWSGRENSWRKICSSDIAWGFQPVDAAWFNRRLYLGAQQGIWTLEKGKVVSLQEVERNAPNATNGGRLDVSADGKYMLTAGPHGACLHDGKDWQRIFSKFDYL